MGDLYGYVLDHCWYASERRGWDVGLETALADFVAPVGTKPDWVGGFAVQAVLRGVFFDTSIPAALGMMTGVAFILFTNYMITDPGTSPSRPGAQVAFGAGVAAVYTLAPSQTLRVTYGTPHENDRFLAAMGEVLG